MRFLLAIALTAGLAGSLTLGAETLRAGAARATSPAQSGPAAAPAETERAARDAYAKLPLSFTSNAGQLDPAVRYYAQGSGFGFYFTDAEAVLSFIKRDRPAERQTEPAAAESAGTARGTALALRFLGANPTATVEPQGRLPGVANFLIGSDPAKWRTGVNTYAELAYRNLWPGVDMAVRGQGGQLKYEFHLAPGARVEDVRLAWRGADGLSLAPSGELLIETPLGQLTDAAPLTYQLVAGRQVVVASRYELGAGGYSFIVDAYDPALPLVIDPGLLYSTYLGGGDSDSGRGIAVDRSGNAYVTGETYSGDFPTTLGAFDTTRNAPLNGNADVFVTKLDATGTTLLYSTYLGGANFDYALGIAVDGAGNAHVAGYTISADFPTTVGAFDTTLNGTTHTDVFVIKLDPTGSTLVFSTLLGGSFSDEAHGIALDGSGNVYITGHTPSADFPTTIGAFDATLGGSIDAFVTKIDPTGSTLLYSTYLGGANFDFGDGIAVDAHGNAYVTGHTYSTDFPTTVGAFDATFNGNDTDAFVSKLNAAGSTLVYSTFLGGASLDYGYGIAVDSSGSAFVTGFTYAGFPTTTGGFDTTSNGYAEAFVVKLSAGGSTLLYSTYLGGAGHDAGYRIVVDNIGNAYVTGYTESADFPTTPGALDATFNGNRDVFVIKLDPIGTTLLYSTYLGGLNIEAGLGITLDAAGSIYLTGYTLSANFPTTLAAFDTTYGGNSDAFVVKLEMAAIAADPATVSVTPATDTNQAGEEHCVTATVRDAAANPTPNIMVVFSVSGANTAGGTVTTNASGQAIFCYTGTKLGEDAITAFADTDGSGSRNGTEPTGAATKTYVAAAPATLVLTPSTATTTVGTQHCVTATVRDAFGNPTSGVTVRFSVSGSVTTSGSSTTNGSGAATFCYTGPELPGSDAITAFADSDGNGSRNGTEPTGAATKTWTLPLSTPLCQLSITNGGRITASNGDKATFGGNAQVPKSGPPKGSETYQDHGPAVKLTVKSTKILAVVCSADKTQASIYGEATINGTGSYLFRIDVQDLAEPGVGRDTYRILLSNGYDSGVRTLEAGNVQIKVG